MSELLTPENWTEAVKKGLAALPEDVQASVGWQLSTDGKVIISIAKEPTPGEEHEFYISKIDVELFPNIGTAVRALGWTPEEWAKFRPEHPFPECSGPQVVCTHGCHEIFSYIGESTPDRLAETVYGSVLVEFNDSDRFDRNDHSNMMDLEA